MQIYLSFSMMFAAIFTFPSEMAMLLKERSSDMYRLSAYYLARSTATLPLDLLYPLIFVSLAYWMGGLRVAVRPAACRLALALAAAACRNMPSAL